MIVGALQPPSYDTISALPFTHISPLTLNSTSFSKWGLSSSPSSRYSHCFAFNKLVRNFKRYPVKVFANAGKKKNRGPNHNSPPSMSDGEGSSSSDADNRGGDNDGIGRKGQRRRHVTHRRAAGGVGCRVGSGRKESGRVVQRDFAVC